jgi:tRNA-(ms[2]io[6]A)-hydroxylase
VLALASSTEAAWLDRVLEDLDAVLLDHAHCEKKAAGMAIRLIFQYPERPVLAARLEEVLRWLERRGLALRRQRPAPYAARLHRLVRTAEPGRLVDTLLCCAVIEARSCERLGLLADALPEPDLAAFYRSLHAAEARHHAAYVELACRVAPREEVRDRLRQIAAREADILSRGPHAARLHG